MDFRRQLNYKDSEISCTNSGGDLPVNTLSYTTCAEKMTKRMQALFKLKELPVIWTTQPEESLRTGMRHVLCYAGKFNSGSLQCSCHS